MYSYMHMYTSYVFACVCAYVYAYVYIYIYIDRYCLNVLVCFFTVYLCTMYLHAGDRTIRRWAASARPTHARAAYAERIGSGWSIHPKVILLISVDICDMIMSLGGGSANVFRLKVSSHFFAFFLFFFCPFLTQAVSFHGPPCPLAAPPGKSCACS